ncbi:MAG: DUF3570 domain-containing protein [Gammaproteobacteria bacterium]
MSLALLSWPGLAAVLPEDRADVLYHSYEGGGVKIDGPSVLVRKQASLNTSVVANYYVDMVTSASIDVVTTASQYLEEREQKSVGIDYLHGKSIMSLSYTTSEEKDYQARTASLSVSQDMFGDLTTVTLGYSRGWDVVGMSTDPAFSRDAERQNYSIGLTQVLTKNLVMGAIFEAITDEGFLNNPYRTVRYIDGGVARGYSYQSEVYPNTRASTALALRAKYYLPYRAALYASMRLYQDDWGINANDLEFGYTHPLGQDWIFDVRMRTYSQTRADFYSDLYAGQDAQNFLARDKELSTFSDLTLGFAVSYEFAKGGWGFIDKASANLGYDRIQFDFEDFRDLRSGGTVGSEPLYSYSANVLRLFVSIWY